MLGGNYKSKKNRLAGPGRETLVILAQDNNKITGQRARSGALN